MIGGTDKALKPWQSCFFSAELGEPLERDLAIWGIFSSTTFMPVNGGVIKCLASVNILDLSSGRVASIPGLDWLEVALVFGMPSSLPARCDVSGEGGQPLLGERAAGDAADKRSASSDGLPADGRMPLGVACILSSSSLSKISMTSEVGLVGEYVVLFFARFSDLLPLTGEGVEFGTFSFPFGGSSSSSSSSEISIMSVDVAFRFETRFESATLLENIEENKVESIVLGISLPSEDLLS